MKPHRFIARPWDLLGALTALFFALTSSALAQTSIATLPEISVTGTREGELLVETPASVGIIKKDALRFNKPTHPSQIMGQVPGVAVAVTNGEGHTIAIRHPFTTTRSISLEDDLTVPPAFNHNALYEINVPNPAASK